MRSPSLYSQDDPITAAMKPPSTETDSERALRLEAEAEAKRVSEQIDEDLREERERLKKKKSDVKLLLLGQAESGKSTLQKQFQLMYKPNSIDQERSSWTAVIYFNVVHSLKQILNTLEQWDDVLDDENGDILDIAPEPSHRAKGNGIADQPSPSTSLMGGNGTVNGSPGSVAHSDAPSTSNAAGSSKDAGAIQIGQLRRRLSPLMAAESQLADRLSGGITVSGSGKGGVYVRSGWQARTIENALTMIKRPSTANEKRPRISESQDFTPDPMVQEIGRMLEACEEDIHELWSNPTVKGMIAKRRLKLDEWSEFFLRHISRVASPDYVPTTDDILHARIQTMGVAEHIFDVNIHGKLVTWHLFDVGGARGQRHSWVPYFDDANAIIFVAPVSAFDQYLEEDPRVNRIDDSLQLFTQVCSNALLKSVHLVLFLNKTDLLKAKLDKGLKVRKYITSFGERSNDYETVVQYFRAHFLQVHRRNNENRRVLYTHFTSVVDTKATQRIIGNVRDSIFRGYLQSAALV
ncbi:Guanine nucleotide-binding protein alpha-4 subunit [Psilocybe cubensis]|uniref:Guanine nucleotide-binding protein alpha-4 subunit n=2 Tax=Psilocybe cubensis TaxID=181762 RepID=A0ACB8H214_PSICU|nr:Guanine nucleotide-binding protein alpha-4 subunit [Psilocybe cubensis]KAH9481235.1 Guanine nucleotide-binding protein alpha-4 subunit [Psilocybe cubensis]